MESYLSVPLTTVVGRASACALYMYTPSLELVCVCSKGQQGQLVLPAIFVLASASWRQLEELAPLFILSLSGSACLGVHLIITPTCSVDLSLDPQLSCHLQLRSEFGCRNRHR